MLAALAANRELFEGGRSDSISAAADLLGTLGGAAAAGRWRKDRSRNEAKDAVVNNFNCSSFFHVWKTCRERRKERREGKKRVTVTHKRLTRVRAESISSGGFYLWA
jgi:hypothetical protein